MADEKDPDPIKRSDQLALLEALLVKEQTGEWKGLFTYPNCGYDLVRCGLASEDAKITTAGKAALYLARKGPDPFPDDKSFVSFSIPLPKEEPDDGRGTASAAS